MMIINICDVPQSANLPLPTVLFATLDGRIQRPLALSAGGTMHSQSLHCLFSESKRDGEGGIGRWVGNKRGRDDMYR